MLILDSKRVENGYQESPSPQPAKQPVQKAAKPTQDIGEKEIIEENKDNPTSDEVAEDIPF